MRSCLWTACLLVVLSPFLSAGPAVVAADPGQRGPYEVGFTFSLAVDSDRASESGHGGRPVPIYLWYPVDPADIGPGTPRANYPLDPYYGILPAASSLYFEAYGLDRAYDEPDPASAAPLPLVVFSPGWGASPLFHVSIGTRLASHGFAVAIVAHFGDATLPWEPLDHLAVASVNRPRDLSFALDHLLDRGSNGADFLFGAVDPERVAVAGWSLGGYAALALAGGDDLVCDSFFDPALVSQWGFPPQETCLATLPDTRFRALVTLDGSNQLLRFRELSRISVPTLGIGQEFETALDWQARQHAAVQAHPCYRIDLRNSIHQSFSDACEAYQVMGDLGLLSPGAVDAALAAFCSSSLPSSRAHDLVNKYMVAFLKTHLVGEAGFQHLLTPGWALRSEPDIEFFVTERRNPRALDVDWPDLDIYFPDQPGSAAARAGPHLQALRPVSSASLER